MWVVCVVLEVRLGVNTMYGAWRGVLHSVYGPVGWHCELNQVKRVAGSSNMFLLSSLLLWKLFFLPGVCRQILKE